jgi:hypothetical protein
LFQVPKRLAGIGAAALLASTACGFPSGLNASNPSFSLSPAGSFAAVTAPAMPNALQAQPVVADEPVTWSVVTSVAEPSFFTPPVEALIELDAAPATVPAVLAEPLAITHMSFRLGVPYRTQKDGSVFQGSNCGPATLGMVLDAFGIRGSTNDDLRFATHEYQGTLGRRGGTALQHMASVGRDHGLTPVGLYASREDFTKWTIDDVRSELRAGRPVIPLVKYRLLPGYEGSTVRYDHYITVYGISGDGFLYHDPAQPTASQGAGRFISAEQLDLAMSSASVSRQAVSFDRAAMSPLTVTQLRS